MTISKKQLVEAAFWEAEKICLSCGSVEEIGIGPCEECGEDLVVPVSAAMKTLDNVEAGNEEE